MSDKKLNKMVYTALLAALICVATFLIKVPMPITNGYSHIGDGFIFIAVILLGGKSGALAAALGAALADILGGYAIYALPTFIIKGVMALIMGYVVVKMDNKNKYLIGSFLGSVWQVIAYYLVGAVMVGSFITPLVEIIGNSLQSLVGIIIMVVFLAVFKNTPLSRK
ncbi:MAG: transporter component [Bacillota bacterium]|jgi:uncharacterized membrane protein|nr:transporter component [Bacillota bacterium]